MATRKSGKIFVGIGGWNFAPWRGTFYPQGLTQSKELHYASRELTSIEINSTFYGLQKPATFQKWHDETPDGFVFSVKDLKSTRLNSSHMSISYAVFCLKKKTK